MKMKKKILCYIDNNCAFVIWPSPTPKKQTFFCICALTIDLLSLFSTEKWHVGIYPLISLIYTLYVHDIIVTTLEDNII